MKPGKGVGAKVAEVAAAGPPGRDPRLDRHQESLQGADSVEGVLAVLRGAAKGTPGFGRGAVYLVERGRDPQVVTSLAGPQAKGTPAHEHELLGMARRAVREKVAVRQTGSAGEALWAVPLGPVRRIEGVMAGTGEPGDLITLAHHAGLALVRERRRANEEGRRRAAEARSAALERTVATLDAIARDGSCGSVARRIVAGVARIPELGRAGLWTLRPEDGVYVELAKAGGDGRGPFDGELAPPPECRRGESFAEWSRSLPGWAGFRWLRGATAERPTPGPGDALLVPLPGSSGPHAVGFLLAEVTGPPEGRDTAEDLKRWALLARLVLESGLDLGVHRRNVEALREEKERMAELHTLKSQFIAAVSHELRTPLTSISAYAETLRNPEIVTDEANRSRFLKVIQDESRRLTRIVDDILDLATVDAGHVRLSCRTTRLADVVESAFDVMRPLAAEKGVRIADLGGADASVHADPDLLKQLVVNLLENAVKFSPADGTIRVEIKEEGSAARITVEDEGPGIPVAELDAVFERFYQVDGSRTREHGGSGLGLAICRSITTWHDGRIWAESGEGLGGRLVVSLPRTRAKGRERTRTPLTEAPENIRHRVPELMTEMVAEVLGAGTVSLMLLDRGRRELFIQAALGLGDEAIRDVRVAVGERISGFVAKAGETLHIPDLAADGRFDVSTHATRYRTHSLISVPVTHRGEIVGVLNVTNKTDGNAFDDGDRRLLEIVAQRVALVLGKLREPGSTAEHVERMEEAIRGVIDARRHYFPSGADFSRLVVAVCREMGVDPDETAHIRYASILRDVGMTRIPDGVYKKPAKLSAEDRAVIRSHPEEGAKVLRPIEFRPDVFDIILSHHEEPAGTGYPRGLTGGHIPRGARILGVLDAYHSLRSGRPWRKPVTHESAIDELRLHAGKQFDPEVVDALIRVLGSHRNRGES